MLSNISFRLTMKLHIPIHNVINTSHAQKKRPKYEEKKNCQKKKKNSHDYLPSHAATFHMIG